MTPEELRRAALSLPQSVEVETWGDPTFRVGQKIFCILRSDGLHATVKATREQQAELLATAPAVFTFAPYVGRHGWVLVDVPHVDTGEMTELLEEAWRQVAPKRVVTAFDQD